jgi:hypothetical protein
MATAITQRDKTLSGLLLLALVLAGVALVREGPHYDNVLDGWRFFMVALFSGALIGFVGVVRLLGVTPALSISGAARLPWLAALALGLGTAVAASWFNRAFAVPTDRMMVAEVDSIEDGKGSRWHVTVKLPDGRFARYLIDEAAADRLKDAKTVRLTIAHGTLGFDFVAGFEPASAPPK